MLVLRNIKRENNFIEASFFPENKTEGFIKVDVNTKDIVELKNAKGFEHWTAPAHALYELLRMKNRETFPEERIVMWY